MSEVSNICWVTKASKVSRVSKSSKVSLVSIVSKVSKLSKINKLVSKLFFLKFFSDSFIGVLTILPKMFLQLFEIISLKVKN